MMHVFAKFIGVLAITVSAAPAFAGWGHGHDHDDDDYKKQILETRAAPVPYGEVYDGNGIAGQGIGTVKVTIEDFWLRTAEGNVIKIKTDYMNIDMQDLIKFKKGLLVDLNKAVNLPRQTQEIRVVEIETKIVDVRPNYINLQSGSYGNQCKLKTPKFLNFYIPAADPLVLRAKTAYYIKIGRQGQDPTRPDLLKSFEPRDAIQLDVVTQKIQKLECDCSWFSDKEECKPVGKPVIKRALKCELVKRRYPIFSFSRVIDEA